MYSPDFINRKEVSVSKAREDIPVEVANKIQIELILMMTPESIMTLVDSGHTELMDGVAVRFAAKYLDKTNAFNAFCADKDTDPEALLRLQSGEYTGQDLKLIIEHMTKLSGEQALFKDEVEVQDFIKQKLH